MINYKIDKQNEEYLIIEKENLMKIIAAKNTPASITQATFKMYKKLVQFETENNLLTTTLSISKNCITAKYLIENNGTFDILDITEYISYENIKDAYLIAAFRDDYKISNKILPLFQNQRYGLKKDLLKEFPRYEDVFNYILENNSFKKQLAQVNNIEMEEQEAIIILYENGNWSFKILDSKYERILARAENTPTRK